jgi:hypothetical protein
MPRVQPEVRRYGGYGRALANRRFRWLLLAVAGIGIVPSFLWNAAGAALLSPNDRFDDFKVFQRAASLMASGANPYSDFIGSAPADQAHWDSYIYPPFLAYLLQPIASLDGVPRALLITAGGLICLGVALWAICQALGIRDRQTVALMALLFAGFFPVVDNFHWGQLNLLLLALTSMWCWSYADGGRWWGAIALGFGIAIKLLQAPLLLAYVAARHWRSLAIALVAAGGLLLLGARWLPTYVSQVFPAIGGGTAWMGNISPTGALLRFSSSDAYLSRPWISYPWATAAGTAIAIAVLAADYALARRAAPGRPRRLAEAALLVASLPLISPLTWDGHLALQLLPLCIVAWIAVPRRAWLALVLAGCGIALMGPANALFWTLATSGALSYSPFARPLAELPTLGVVVNWAAVAVAAHALAGPAQVARRPAWPPDARQQVPT